MAVTLRQVASRAGVSPIVVSRVLHNRALSINVTEATAERVRLAAKELGYRRNILAVNFRTGHSMTIAVFHFPGSDVPQFGGGNRYFGTLMDGLIEGAFAHDYAITLCPKLLGQSPGDALSDGRFDGLVMYSTDLTEANRTMLKRCTSPVVLVHTKASVFGCSMPSVCCDNFQGIQLAVDHLVGLGHRHIGFAQEPKPTNIEIGERYAAFLELMEQRGLPGGQDAVVTAGLSDEELAPIFSGKFTAIVAWNDTMAGRIIEAAPHFGIEIPRDLSIVGFDSTSYCNELKPALTSVSQPLQQIGVRAIDLLVSFIRGETSGLAQDTYPCGLDVRGSTKSAEVLVKS